MIHTKGRAAGRATIAGLMAAAALQGCGDEGGVAGRWACPTGWVTYGRGGCGPAELLCAPGGGAAPGACPAATPDASAAPGLRGAVGDPCPPGWRTLSDRACALPSPYDCPAGEYATPDDLADGRPVIHVRAGADASAADGSRQRPFATIMAALAHAGAGATVLVAAGEYRERFAVSGGAHVRVVGLCAERVTIRSPGDDTAAAGGSGTELDLRGVTVTGPNFGLHARDGGTLRAVGVVVSEATGTGAVANGPGSLLELRASVVRWTRLHPTFGGGYGLSGAFGATLRASGVLIEGNTKVGVLAAERARVEVEASVIRRTHPTPEGLFGRGLEANTGATLRATGVLVEGNAEASVRASDAGTELEVTSSVVRGTRARPRGTHGHGLQAMRGAALRVSRVLVTDHMEVGLHATDRGTLVTLSDVRVARVAPSARGFGVGLYAMHGARVVGARVAIHDVAGAGAVALPFGGVAATRVVLDDLFVRGVRSSTVRFAEDVVPTRTTGIRAAYGLNAGPGCAVEASRAVIDDGGFGFFNARGVVQILRGVVARQDRAAGAFDRSTATSATLLREVAFADNVDDRVAPRDDLPEVSVLPPARPCTDAGCDY